ncbi:forkhead box protein N2-like isoform X2 [Watersipora subatra]|uniref:forkhead box protein N2-like isoform X2 n=1 Tax=Watersipora subatra TaxID=2589382 RepID=UPI00355C6A7B
MIEVKAEAMPVVSVPSTWTPPPQMDADDLLPLQNGMVLMDVTSDEQVQMSQQKLREGLSFSHTGGSLVTEFAKIKPEEDLLSQSCFSQIRLEKGGDDFDDDELTPLDWLQDGNLLKNISEKARVCLSPPSSDEDCDYDSGKENDALNSSFTSQGMSPLPHPSHIPYNPQKHVNSKPPYSFSCLIFMAIEESTHKRLPVKDIYMWILTNFPYFQNAPTGWKNSVRHNLSLNKCFQKVDRDKSGNIGKGSFWCIDPEYRPTLLQALRKTPYHPYHQLQMMSVSPMQMTPQKFPFIHKFGNKSISPHLFPFLSKRLNSTQTDSLDTDIDVAKALVSLKKSRSNRHGSKHNSRARSLSTSGELRSRSPSPPEFGSTEDRARTTNRSRRANSPIIVTEVPSVDHTYSSCSVPKGLLASPTSSSIDGEYEFHDVEERDLLLSGDEFDSEEEEEMSMEQGDSGKEMEGVNALLNLASVATSVMSDLVSADSTDADSVKESFHSNTRDEKAVMA